MTLPLHLGPLHPVEQLLVFALAFGPFVVLAVVILLQRRRDRDVAREHDPAHVAREHDPAHTEHDRA